MDVAGLLKWSTLTNKNKRFSPENDFIFFDVWTVQTNDGSATIELWKYVSGAPSGLNYTYNCHGYTFGDSKYWINGQINAILSGDGYREIIGADKKGAKVAYWGSDIHTAKVNTVDGVGNVTQVTGKLGAKALLSSTPAGQGYSGTIKYYE